MPVIDGLQPNNSASFNFERTRLCDDAASPRPGGIKGGLRGYRGPAKGGPCCLESGDTLDVGPLGPVCRNFPRCAPRKTIVSEQDEIRLSTCVNAAYTQTLVALPVGK